MRVYTHHTNDNCPMLIISFTFYLLNFLKFNDREIKEQLLQGLKRRDTEFSNVLS